MSRKTIKEKRQEKKQFATAKLQAYNNVKRNYTKLREEYLSAKKEADERLSLLERMYAEADTSIERAKSELRAVELEESLERSKVYTSVRPARTPKTAFEKKLDKIAKLRQRIGQIEAQLETKS